MNVSVFSCSADIKPRSTEIDQIELLEDSFNKLSLQKKQREIYFKTIYFSLKFHSNEILSLLEILENICPEYKEKYEIQSEFHITVLFIKKDTEQLFLLVDLIGKEYTATIDRLGISNDFIVLGVSNIKDKDNNDMPYYGNSIKHITIGKKKGKKLASLNSYLALNKYPRFRKAKVFDKNSTVIIFDSIKKLTGIFENITKG